MVKIATLNEKNLTRFIVSSLVLLAIVALLLAGGAVVIISHLSSQIELVALQKADNSELQSPAEAFTPKIVVAGQIAGSEWDHGQIVIFHPAVLENSLIFITPITKPRGNWWVSNIVPGESFTVESSASNENMSFNWLITDTPNPSD